MDNKKFKIRCDHSTIIESLLDAIKEIGYVLQHTPVVTLESKNLFGDIQLHLDVQCDNIVEKHMRENALVRGIASQERPEYIQLSTGEGGYDVTYDPVDGSSIIDTNFAVGTIISIWPHDENKLIGKKIGSQTNAMLAIYGPRTTVILYNPEVEKVQQITLIDGQWTLSHDNCIIKPKTNIFSPGNSRSASENEKYSQLISGWISKGYTLRYTGGLVPDVGQIFIKGHGVFSCGQSKNYKAKLRVLYEVASIAFLIEKAGGKTITNGKIPLTEYIIKTYHDKLAFGVGSAQEIQAVSTLF